MKKLQVLVVFEFDGIDDSDSPDAEMAIEGVTRRTAWWNGETEATSVWVQDAMVVEDEEITK